MKNKISLYDIVNKFFVGAVFTLLLVVVTVDKLPLVDIYNHYSDILKDWSVIVSAVLWEISLFSGLSPIALF